MSVRCSVDDAVAWITLDRPEKYNAADEGMHAELASIWKDVAADPETRVAVITGAGKAFSAGGDLVAGAAHWLADGGAKKIGDVVGGAASAVGGAAKAVGSAVSGAVSCAANVAGKVASSVGGAIGGAAKSVGGAIGGAAKSVGGAIGGAAKKIFSGW